MKAYFHGPLATVCYVYEADDSLYGTFQVRTVAGRAHVFGATSKYPKKEAVARALNAVNVARDFSGAVGFEIDHNAEGSLT